MICLWSLLTWNEVFFIYKMSDSSDRELQIIQFVQRVIVLKSTNFIVYLILKCRFPTSTLT